MTKRSMPEESSSSYRKYLRNIDMSVPKSTFYRWKRADSQKNNCTNMSGSCKEKCLETDSNNCSEQREHGVIDELGNSQTSDLSEQSHSQESDADDMTENEIENDEPVKGDTSLKSPIYSGASMTEGELLSLLMAFTVRHKISGLALKDLIKLISTVLPNSIPSSKYFVDKIFFNMTEELVFNYLCDVCDSLIEENQSACPSCENSSVKDELKQKGSFFLTLPLSLQIKDLFENHKLKDHIIYKKVNNENTRPLISDISDGKFYKKSIIQDFLSQGENITLPISTDGVPVFNSSNSSFWPVFCSINELKQKKKSEFIILHSLWFGPKKPSPNTFLKPLVDEVNDLYNNGVVWFDNKGTKHTTKCLPLICVCDSVARPLLQNMKQFNGKYGCSFCLHPGVQTPKGNGSVRVWPFTDEYLEGRDNNQFIEHASEAQPSGKPCYGVKGPSILSLIPHFDIVHGLPPDYMHSVLLGVVRQVTELLFDSSSHAKPHYLGKHSSAVDRLLTEIRTPNEITRRPRQMSLRKYWKASEWRSFLLFFSPVIYDGILQKEYFHHWLLLVNALLILLGEKISSGNLIKAKLCLTKFVLDFEKLYGLEHISFNIHLLTHLSECVENWGPLFSSSAFIFEDASGRLLSLIHGTQHVDIQTFKWFSAQRKLSSFAKTHLGCASETVQVAFNEISETQHLIQKADVISNSTVLGSPTIACLTVRQKILLERLKGKPILNTKCLGYNRLCSNSFLYTTSAYAAGHKRDNSVVQLKNDTLCRIEHILLCSLFCTCATECDCSDEIFIFGQTLMPSRKQPKIVDKYAELNLLEYFKQIDGDTTTTIIFGPCEIKHKCVVVSRDNNEYVMALLPFENN